MSVPLRHSEGGLKLGTRVIIGGQAYDAPQLNLGGLRVVIPLSVQLSNGEISAFDFVRDVLRLSLRRNYPEVTDLWLETQMEADEFKACDAAVTEILQASGVVAAKKDAQPGEA